eukprot:2462333-Prymnesium_polylepis.2
MTADSADEILNAELSNKHRIYAPTSEWHLTDSITAAIKGMKCLDCGFSACREQYAQATDCDTSASCTFKRPLHQDVSN